jgi:Protein of unknown function (DUF2480)
MTTDLSIATETGIVNRVANSGLITLNLEDFRPAGEVVGLDIEQALFMGLVLREKEFRAWCQAHPWAQYAGKHVAVFCSADAIVPAWAYMLLTTYLQPVAASVGHGTVATYTEELLLLALDRVEWEQYADEKIVLKGCGGVSVAVYVRATEKLMPHVAKIMYGEPCSMVPLYKRK